MFGHSDLFDPSVSSHYQHLSTHHPEQMSKAAVASRNLLLRVPSAVSKINGSSKVRKLSKKLLYCSFAIGIVLRNKNHLWSLRFDEIRPNSQSQEFQAFCLDPTSLNNTVHSSCSLSQSWHTHQVETAHRRVSHYRTFASFGAHVSMPWTRVRLWSIESIT